MIRAVLDTNVVVSALLFSGQASRLVPAWQAARFRPVLSSSILQEYLRVLGYPKFRLTTEEIRALIEEELLPFVETVHVMPSGTSLSRDPDDAKFLECALSGDVPWIVSGDKDLLAVGRINSIRVVTLSAFIDLLKRAR